MIPPEILDPAKADDIARISQLTDDETIEVVDRLSHQVEELERIASISGENVPDNYSGVWIFYPWTRSMVRTLNHDDFRKVRTNRNQNKITSQEQDLLSSKRIGIIGMSVGRSIATTMSMERIFGHLKLADMDTLDLSNLNRLKAPIRDLGLKKTESVQRELHELDPFLSVETFDDGITAANIDDFLLGNGKLDLLIEECDNLEIKLLCRVKAKEHGIPVIMETSDRGMIDIERFDIEPDRPIFHGFLDGLNLNSLNFADPEVRKQLLARLLDFSNVSPRGLSSLQEVGKTLLTWPQLASAVTLGGGSVTDTSRRILLGEFDSSGRYYVDLHELIE